MRAFAHWIRRRVNQPAIGRPLVEFDVSVCRGHSRESIDHGSGEGQVFRCAVPRLLSHLRRERDRRALNVSVRVRAGTNCFSDSLACAGHLDFQVANTQSNWDYTKHSQRNKQSADDQQHGELRVPSRRRTPRGCQLLRSSAQTDRQGPSVHSLGDSDRAAPGFLVQLPKTRISSWIIGSLEGGE